MSDDRTPAQVAWANYWHGRIASIEGLRRADFMAGFDAAVEMAELRDRLSAARAGDEE